MIWEDVQKLRKEQRFQDAVDLGLQGLDENPDDFRLRGQIDWAFYGLVKNHVAAINSKLKEGQSVPSVFVERLYRDLRRYAALPRRRQDAALSNMLREISKVAQHLNFFAGFIRWFGLDGLSTDDLNYNLFEGKRYPSIAHGVARGFVKWVKSFPGASQEDVFLALEWIGRVRTAAEGDEALWLDWDKVYLLRLIGRHEEAAGVIGPVLKAKRNEFWVWAEAARIYAEDQPDLALACVCRALECGSDPKFMVKIHRELAAILADRGEFSQASAEINTAISLRQEQGWPIDAELQKLINSNWYDPSAEQAEPSRDFYARHSQDALVLCFDFIEVKAANYVGIITMQQSKGSESERKVRPLPRFAIRDSSGKSIGIVSPGVRYRGLKMGDPVVLVLGRQSDSDRDVIVQISVRSDGQAWDCADTGSGLIYHVAEDGGRVKVFIDRDRQIGIDRAALLGPVLVEVGQGVRFRMVENKKNGRIDIFCVESGPLPTSDVKFVTGVLKRNPKGFAFIDDVFVAPPLVDTIPGDVEVASALVVYMKNRKEGRYGWRAVSLRPA